MAGGCEWNQGKCAGTGRERRCEEMWNKRAEMPNDAGELWRWYTIGSRASDAKGWTVWVVCPTSMVEEALGTGVVAIC